MVFAAYSAGYLFWFPAEATRRDQVQTIPLGKGLDVDGKRSSSEAVDILADAAGTASIVIVAYSARRSTSWRTSRHYQGRPRCQTAEANCLPKTWDMPNFGQANGRATGDFKAMLLANTNRDYITYLGHQWDHAADLATEAFVEEVGRRMEGGMSMNEAMDSERHPFPVACNFRLAIQSRGPPSASRKTIDRREMFEHKDRNLYQLHLLATDPRSEELAALAPGRTTRRAPGITSMGESSIESAIAQFPETTLQAAGVVAARVLVDAGSTLELYAAPDGITVGALQTQLPQIHSGEQQDALLVTEVLHLTLADLGLVLELPEATAELHKEAFGLIGQAVKGFLGQGTRYCWLHTMTHHAMDVRTQSAKKRMNGTWRAYEKNGSVEVAVIRYVDPAPGPSTSAEWVWDRLQRTQGRRIVWHTFTRLPTVAERKHDPSLPLQLSEPGVELLTRGPIVQCQTTDPPKRKRETASLLDMIHAGLIQPAQGVISTTYRGVKVVADLLADGKISMAGGEGISLTAFRLRAMEQISGQPARSASGWATVDYEGVNLDRIRQQA